MGNLPIIQNQRSSCRQIKIPIGPIPQSLRLCSNSVQSLRHLGLSKCLWEFRKRAFLWLGYTLNADMLIGSKSDLCADSDFPEDSLFWWRQVPASKQLAITIVSRSDQSFLCLLNFKDLDVQTIGSILNLIVQEVSHWNICIVMINFIIPASSHPILFSSLYADRPSLCS